jgi:hypothetical protein
LPLSIEMVFFPRSWVPYRWPKPQSPCKLDSSIYTPRGDSPDPYGGEAALDSGCNLRRGSLADGSGDPGRWLREVLKEARDQGRAYAEFVPYHMVEYYRQSPRARHNLYTALSQWWKEVWVSENMYVPLPPILTCRASAFIPDKVDDDSWAFYQSVLEAKWTVLVFSRWYADMRTLSEGLCGRYLPGCGRTSKNWVSRNSSRVLSMQCRTYRRGSWIMSIIPGLQ